MRKKQKTYTHACFPFLNVYFPFFLYIYIYIFSFSPLWRATDRAESWQARAAMWSLGLAFPVGAPYWLWWPAVGIIWF